MNKMNKTLWVLQGLLALLFLFAGGMKLVVPIADMTKDFALPGPFLRFIGVAEVLGGLGLVLPGLSGIRPALTPLAAAGLVIIMIGATAISFAIGGLGTALIPLLVGLALAFIAYARWRLVPHREALRGSGITSG
ncbi:MAG: DoxX family protein [bacterium]